MDGANPCTEVCEAAGELRAGNGPAEGTVNCRKRAPGRDSSVREKGWYREVSSHFVPYFGDEVFFYGGAA